MDVKSIVNPMNENDSSISDANVMGIISVVIPVNKWFNKQC